MRTEPFHTHTFTNDTNVPLKAFLFLAPIASRGILHLAAAPQATIFTKRLPPSGAKAAVETLDVKAASHEADASSAGTWLAYSQCAAWQFAAHMHLLLQALQNKTLWIGWVSLVASSWLLAGFWLLG